MQRPKSVFRLMAEPLTVALALAFAARAVVRIYAVPSTSMSPTLQMGDRILVTNSAGDNLERGVVVVFRSSAGAELLVKRIVAVPGELVESRDGRFAVSGRILDEGYLLPNSKTTDVPRQIVPSGCYFVMGDNRENSVDSRVLGVIPASRIVGRARLVLWSATGTSSHSAANAAAALTFPGIQSDTGLRLFHPIE